MSTLLFDLLSEEEERVDQFTGELRFNIELLTRRVVGVTDWLRQNAETGALGIGYFGASTGAAAALEAAAPTWPWRLSLWWLRRLSLSWGETTTPSSR